MNNDWSTVGVIIYFLGLGMSGIGVVGLIFMAVGWTLMKFLAPH